MTMPHLVALECGLTPRQRETERKNRQQAPPRGPHRIGPARPVHPETHPAPHGAGETVAPRAIDRELAEQIEEQEQRDARKGLVAFRLDADEEVGEIDRHKDREREQKSDQQFPATSGVFRRVAIERGMRPQMTADVGGEPEPVEAEGNQLQPGAALHQSTEFAAISGENRLHRRGRQGRRRRWKMRHRTHLVHGRRPPRKSGRQCPLSEVRETSRRPLTRTSESKGTGKDMILVPLSI